MTDRDELGKTMPRSGTSTGPVSAREELPKEPEGRYALPDDVKDPELGRGGMGRVLSLVDTHLKREVAVKEMLLEHTAERSSSGPLLENLFVREARVLALLEHPGVVPVYELGRRADGAPYYAMRKIRGRSMHSVLEQAVSLDERLSMLPHFITVVQTIGYAHSRGVVHRDLKPDNVMVSRFGETQVIDWGLAIVAGEPIEGGVMAGTPAYMSPEQAAGTSVDARSDVWSLGVMLYELLAGKLPFEGSSASAILDAVRTSPLPPLASVEPAAPAALVAIVEKALQRQPSARYQDAGQMADALEAAQRARAPRPLMLWAAVGLLGVSTAMLSLVAFSASGRVDDANRDSRLRVADAQRASSDAIAQAALAALRDKDTARAQRLAAEVGTDPLGRGVGVVAEERGVPEKLWSVRTEAGCASVAAVGTTVACATFGGIGLWGADGASLGTLSTGPTGWQHAVVASGENTVLSGGDDRVLRTWDVAAKKELRQVPGFSAPIRSLARDGDEVVVGLGDGAVMHVKPDGTVEEVVKHPRPVTRLALQGGQVASVSDGLLRVTPLVKGVGGNELELDRHVGAVAGISATELVVGVERSVLVLKNGVADRLSDGHRDDVSALTVVPGDDTAPARLVSGSNDGTVRWWFAEGQAEGTLSEFAPGVQALAATGDGRLVVATTQKRLEAWKLPARTRPPDAVGVPTAHAWWPGQGLVSGYRDGRIRRIDPESGEVHDLEPRHVGPVRALARAWLGDSPDVVRFLSGGDDGRVLAQRWNGSVDTVDTLTNAHLTAIAASRTGGLAAWAADDGTRVVWNLQLDKEVRRERDTVLRALAFSDDGRTLAIGRDDKHVELLDAQTGAVQKQLDPIDAALSSLAFSHDGAWLAAGSQDGHVTLWDVKSGRVLKTFSQPGGRVGTLDFHASNKLLAAGSDDGQAWIFDPGGDVLAQLPVDAGDVLLVAFTDESLVVVGTDRVVHHLHP
ncbi:MAG: serine/threonine-protein kinase [Myxococcaceae bacterium]